MKLAEIIAAACLVVRLVAAAPSFDVRGELARAQDVVVESPTTSPTVSPTTSPTESPTTSPTESPSVSPTVSPTTSPTESPSVSPTVSPTTSPTESPSVSPTTSPTESPTTSPTESPSVSPTTSPTESPSVSPTVSPTTSPTESPSVSPTVSPTTSPTESPTTSPTVSPTTSPTESPTTSPTESPSVSPTVSPTTSPTESPSVSPTTSPTTSPTVSPTTSPTVSPTLSPSTSPTVSPTTSPTVSPTTSPTVSPTLSPTISPTVSPTLSPTISPTLSPTTSPTTSPTNAPTDWNECAVNVALGGEKSWVVDKAALDYQESFSTQLVGGLFLAAERTKFAFASFNDVSEAVVPDAISGSSSVFSEDIATDKVGIQAQMGDYFAQTSTEDLAGKSNTGILDFIQTYGTQMTDFSDEYGSLVLMVTGDVPKKFQKRLLQATAASVNERTIIICVYNHDKMYDVPTFYMPSRTPFCDVLVHRQTNAIKTTTSANIVRNAICANARIKMEDPCPSKTTLKECRSVVRNYRGEDRGFQEDEEVQYRFDHHCEWNKRANECTVTNRHQTLYYILPDESAGPTPPPTSFSCAGIVNSRQCAINGCVWKGKKAKGQCLDPPPPPECEDVKQRSSCQMRVGECQWTNARKKKGNYCIKVEDGSER